VISINTELRDSRILGDPRMDSKGDGFLEGELCLHLSRKTNSLMMFEPAGNLIKGVS